MQADTIVDQVGNFDPKKLLCGTLAHRRNDDGLESRVLSARRAFCASLQGNRSNIDNTRWTHEIDGREPLPSAAGNGDLFPVPWPARTETDPLHEKSVA